MNLLNEVKLVSTGFYLPGKLIPFDEVEKVIGSLEDTPPKIKIMTQKLKNIMKKILKAPCYLAVDLEKNKPMETITSLSVKAIKKALEKAKMKPQEIEYIVLGVPLPDYMTPPTPPFIQQELGIDLCSEIEIHSNCTAMTKAMEVAFDALRVGRHRNAVVVYSQNPSAYLLSTYYNQEKVGVENVLIRWFLSDCAGAVILKAEDKVNSGIKVTGTYNESLGKDLDRAMWMEFGAANFNLHDVFEQGAHHFAQDYQAVNKIGPSIQVKGLKRMFEKYNLKSEDVDHLLISIPSYKLENTAKNLTFKEVGIAPEKWFSNVETKGYCGGAALVTSLDEMLERNLFKAGERAVCFVTESSKWMVGGFVLDYIK